MRAEVELANARVVDPETGLDAIRNVSVGGGRILAVSPDPLPAQQRLDLSGLVLGPGLIDLHSHVHSPLGLRLQACDGVTTALELEEGALPIGALATRVEREGRVINVGYSASWAAARMHVLDGAPLRDERHPQGPGTALEMFEEHQTGARWDQPATSAEIDAIMAMLDAALDEGALGIGVLLGYAPLTSPDELTRLAALVARRRLPLFVHARSMSASGSPSLLDAVDELIDVARTSGAAVHLCHANSTSHRLIGQVLERLRHAQALGIAISTEAYPSGAGCTEIGAAFLDPADLEGNGITPDSIRMMATGERLSSAARLTELRARDPAALAMIDVLDESDPSDLALLQLALLERGAAIASDAMPAAGLSKTDESRWPPVAPLLTHPRSTGCFAKAFRWLVHEEGSLPMLEFFRKASLLPAQLLEEAAPSFRRKGRVQVGADADLVALAPERYREGPSGRGATASSGVVHLFVRGRAVITYGHLDAAAAHGSLLRAGGSP